MIKISGLSSKIRTPTKPTRRFRTVSAAIPPAFQKSHKTLFSFDFPFQLPVLSIAKQSPDTGDWELEPIVRIVQRIEHMQMPY